MDLLAESFVEQNNLLNTTIYNYSLQRVLRQGAFGLLYLAKHIISGKYYVLKQLDKTVLKQERKTEQVRIEKTILTTATSPFILKSTGAFQDPEFLWLALEYCPGGDLKDLLQVQHFEEKEVVLYFAEMIMGVHDLHKMGYSHRDLKLSNFFIDGTGHIKLAGLTRSSTRKTRNIGLRGGPALIRPDITGQDMDWWSLGCVFYEMIFGAPPFPGDSVKEVYSQIDLWGNELPIIFENIREHESPACYSLLTGFLCAPKDRLGRDIEKIKVHPYFEGINWSDLRSMAPPFIPQPPPDMI